MPDFQSLFGRPQDVSADAPGRVNLIGEHTDYNGGFVLPTAIPQRTHVDLALRNDPTVRVWSAAKQRRDGIVSYSLGKETKRKDWLDFIQGTTQVLRADGHAVSGFDIRIESAVPLGSGLSSSASLTVSLMRGLRTAFELKLSDVDIAKIGQRVENEFVGARVGIMDPMAASIADQGTALFLDARTLSYERVPMPRDAELIVIHSGVAHRLAAGDGGYNQRRAECEQACAKFGVSQLRDLSVENLPEIENLPEPLNRRARHVITENERVLHAVEAMKANHLPELGLLFYASHASMRDDYQVSVPEIDLLVDLAREEANVFGARLTGGGFGGSVVMLARAGCGRAAAERIARNYEQRSTCKARILVPAK